MRNLFRTLLALALAALAAAAYADPPGRVGRLSYATGTVSFAAGDAPDQWTRAVLNRPLTGGDRLWADRDGHSELHVGSTAVRLAPLTSLDVLHLDDDRIQLRLARGTLQVRVRDLDHDDLIEIATPAGAVQLRQPGSYRVSADPETGMARVGVTFGHAEVVTPAQTFAVPSGQSLVLAAGGPPAYEIAGAADAFERWSAERDRREDHIASTRYVSPHMTGYEDLDHHGSWRTLPEYGAVWVPTRVAAGWAPYRDGHWAWVSPWGWTWIDDAPWGFAPFHYGRWVWVHDYWAWAPGAIVRRPVYAPALVAFVGGPHFAVSVGRGPAVAWFPLGWREPYHPWYRASARHVHNVNVTYVTNVYDVRHVHRSRPEAVTVVPQHSFVSARNVARSRIHVAQADIAKAEVIRERQPAERVRAGIAPERRAPRPQMQAAPGVAATTLTPPGAPAVRERPEARPEPRMRPQPPRESVDARSERPGEQRGRAEAHPEPGRRGEAEERPSRQRERPQHAQPRSEVPASPLTPQPRSEAPVARATPQPRTETPASVSTPQPRTETPASRPTPQPRTEAPASRPTPQLRTEALPASRSEPPRAEASAPRPPTHPAAPRLDGAGPRPMRAATPRMEAVTRPPPAAAVPQGAAPAPRAQTVPQPRHDGRPRGEHPQREGRARPAAPS